MNKKEVVGISTAGTALLLLFLTRKKNIVVEPPPGQIAGANAGEHIFFDVHLVLDNITITGAQVTCSAPGNIKLGLYSDAGGYPQNIIQYAAGGSGIPVKKGVNIIPFPTTHIARGTYLWIASLSDAYCISYATSSEKLQKYKPLNAPGDITPLPAFVDFDFLRSAPQAPPFLLAFGGYNLISLTGTVDEEPAPGPVRIIGRVVQQVSLFPMPNVYVGIEDIGPMITYTDAQGNFMFEDVPVGWHTFYVDAQDLQYLDVIEDRYVFSGDNTFTFSVPFDYNP